MYYYETINYQPLKILVIEDHADILGIFEYLLEEEGYEVVLCTDGSSIGNLQNIKPDLVILDELLPTANGSDLCKQIKADENTRHIPVLIVSALANVEKIANDCGADAYVEKPFNIDSLLQVVKMLLAASKS